MELSIEEFNICCDYNSGISTKKKDDSGNSKPLYMSDIRRASGLVSDIESFDRNRRVGKHKNQGVASSESALF